MARWRALGYHLAAMALGPGAGYWSIGVETQNVRQVLGSTATHVLGVRGTGYAALLLLGLALAIGPLARLWPRGLSRLLPWRRAIGIWSALAGGVHLYFVWLMVNRHEFDFYRGPLLQHFVRAIRTVDGRTISTLSLQSSLSVLMWLGLIALTILAVIALTSNDPVQRFLGQSSWKLVQQQAYTAFLFISLHVLTMKFTAKMKGNPPLIAGVQWFLLCVALLQLLGFVVTVWRHRRRVGGGEARNRSA